MVVVETPPHRYRARGDLEGERSLSWSLTFQDNLGINEGDLIEGYTYTNVLFFQPAMPVPVGENLIFIGRPVFPLVTSPVLDPTAGVVDGYTTGFGDFQLLSLLGPSRIEGYVWGGGLTPDRLSVHRPSRNLG